MGKAVSKWGSTVITNEVILGLSESFRGRIALWRNNRYEGEAVGKGGKKRWISAGINGQGDITGVLTLGTIGARVEIEVKDKGDRQRKSQREFQGAMERYGAIYIIADANEHENLEMLVDALRMQIRKYLQ